MKTVQIAAFILIFSASLSAAEAQDYSYNNDDNYQSTDQLFYENQQQLDQTAKDVWENSGDSLSDLQERYTAVKDGYSGVVDRTLKYIGDTVDQITGGTSTH